MYCTSLMDLNVELPPDIVKKVLLLLPMSNLCRCHIVCKLWNRLICLSLVLCTR
ncbi:hypothetical protein M758_11G145000 [Ceratodon purpureus]|nr:hypothetical protein M758_11G145000 [Ceratodon purpureus]